MGNECAICAVPYWTFGHTDWAFAAVSDPSFNKNKPTSHAVTLPTKHIVDFGEFFEGDNYRYRTDMDTMTLATIIGQFELGNRFFQLLENLSPNRSVAHIHRHILGAPTVEAALIAQNLEGTPIEIMTGDLTLGMYFTEERRFLDRETLGIMDTSDAKEFATIESFKVRLD
ncbi:hypothetical protein HOF46_01170, partial [Candidatus Woesearchaeota archaeon]|nr:hypothetical protein [Candidatus Woesearchaeota archaeon]